MKKTLSLLLAIILIFALFAGCSSKQAPSGEGKVIKVGASPTPHAEILEVAKEVLAKEGYTLEIVEFTDYILPNTSLEAGEIDANFFQHLPYLEDFNAENGTNIVSIAAVHYEPLGIYPGKTSSLKDLQDGATIAVPNDTTNEARALLLLEANGLIKLKEGVGVKATKNDIVENKRNFKIEEIEAAQLGRALKDVDIAVINGNYAIQAGLKVDEALAKEEATSVAATTYANILAVKAGDEDREDLKALKEALLSDEVKAFIEKTYEGAVVAVF